MGISRGTNIITDNLVLGFDAGYGVADKNTSTRFYKGRPTTNLINFDNSSYGIAFLKILFKSSTAFL